MDRYSTKKLLIAYVCQILLLMPLLASCDLDGEKSTFLDSNKYIAKQAEWGEHKVANYSFECVYSNAYSPTAYVVEVSVENSQLKDRVYKRIRGADVSGLTKEEIAEKINEVKSTPYIDYDDSDDKACLELSSIEDVFRLVYKMYSSREEKYKANKKNLKIDTSISYDGRLSYPQKFSCTLTDKSRSGIVGDYFYGISITNFYENE